MYKVFKHTCIYTYCITFKQVLYSFKYSLDKFYFVIIFIGYIVIYKMDQTVSNEINLKPASGFAKENFQQDLEVTQYNSSVVHEFAKLNIEKASNKIDRKNLKTFNVFVQSS